MDGEKICSTEQDAIIDIKAAILQEASRLYKKNDKTGSLALLKLFDLFPCLNTGNMVDKAHNPCIYPRCAAAIKINQIKKAIRNQKFSDIPKLIQQGEYQIKKAVPG